MKKSLFMLAAVFSFGYASAQTDPKTSPAQPLDTKAHADTTTVQSQLKKDTDIERKEAEKTQDHAKITPKVRKDTLQSKPTNTAGSKKKTKS